MLLYTLDSVVHDDLHLLECVVELLVDKAEGDTLALVRVALEAAYHTSAANVSLGMTTVFMALALDFGGAPERTLERARIWPAALLAVAILTSICCLQVSWRPKTLENPRPERRHDRPLPLTNTHKAH